MLYVIEGSDGSGKDTIAKELAGKIDGDVEIINVPNDDAVTGPMIRSYLRKEWAIDSGFGDDSNNWSPLAFQSLQVTNRMELMPKLNKVVGSKTNHVIAVRYWQSAWVYGQLDGLDPNWLYDIHTTMAQPDVNILLDIDAKTSMARRAARDGDLPPERYEGKLDFTTNVVGLYRALWISQNVIHAGKRYSDISCWARIDATQSVEQITAEILERMIPYGKI